MWAAITDLNGFGDGYGNGGSLQSTMRTFSVQPALLAISIVQPNKVYAVGGILQIYAEIMAPDGTLFTQGLCPRPLLFPVVRLLIQSTFRMTEPRAERFGGYQLGSTDPGGTWLVTVNASDGYGNGGSNSASYTVNVLPLQNLTSNWLLWLGVLTAQSSVSQYSS